MGFLYLGALLVSLLGMILIDARWRLFFFRSPIRATVVLIVGIVFFLAWDVAGISLGVFFRGSGPYMTGVLLGPELPLEELFFLALLCYFTMNVAALSHRLLRLRRMQ